MTPGVPVQDNEWRTEVPSPKRVLVTGGSSPIAKALVRHLFRSGIHTRILHEDLANDAGDIGVPVGLLDRHSASLWPGDAVTLVRGDSGSAAACGANAIVHFGAGTAVSTEGNQRKHPSKVDRTLTMLEAARRNGVQRFVFASFGEASGEVYCQAYWRAFGVETVSLRFGEVYGSNFVEGQSVVGDFCECILRGESLRVGDGVQSDFIFIADAVEAIGHSLRVPNVAGGVFGVVAHGETGSREVAETLQSICRAMGFPVPAIIGARGEPLRSDVPTAPHIDRLPGWQAKRTLRRGLAETLTSLLFAENSAGIPTPVFGMEHERGRVSA